MQRRLSQLLAVEGQIKKRYDDIISPIYKVARSQQQRPRYDGEVRTYTTLREGEPDIPAEVKEVQLNAQTQLSDAREIVASLVDAVASRDAGNQEARATLELDDVTIEDVPATTLLFIEQEFGRLAVLIRSMPDWDPKESWTSTNSAGVHRAEPRGQLRVRKEPRSMELSPAVPPSIPAQTHVYHEDVPYARADVTALTGAMDPTERDRLARRAERVARAAKVAREEANTTQVETLETGAKLLTYVFGAAEA